MISLVKHYEGNKQFLLILAGSLALALASQLSVPLKPVPLTFQTPTFLLIGLLYGAKRSGLVVSAYLFAGAAGLPVFANMSAGFPVLFGPTGGYLLGFFPAAILTGYLAEQGWANSRIGIFSIFCLGTVIIFLFGASWLSLFVGWHKAYLLGVKPFLLTGIIKIIAAVVIAPRFRSD